MKIKGLFIGGFILSFIGVGLFFYEQDREKKQEVKDISDMEMIVAKQIKNTFADVKEIHFSESYSKNDLAGFFGVNVEVVTEKSRIILGVDLPPDTGDTLENFSFDGELIERGKTKDQVNIILSEAQNEDYLLSEKDLVYLNKEAYYVDPNYDRNRVLSSKETANLKENEDNKLYIGGRYFQILSTRNGSHGFQGMAVAPIIDEQADINHVTVVSAGTFPSDIKDVVSAVKGMGPIGSPQGEEAISYVGDIVEKHPDWTIEQLTGYSQSAYMLKVGAHFGIPATVFCGWFQYRSLSAVEEKFMKTHPTYFIDYRQKKDPVTKWNDFNSLWGNSDNFGTITWMHGTSHELVSYTFDAQGNLIIK